TPMAALPSEASCPICLELFRDPVSIHCGHNFCRGCITRCWEWSTEGFPCPQCRETAPERSLRPSRELARVLDIARRLSLRVARGEALDGQEEEEEEEEEGCEKHQEPLRVFCKEDQALLCGVCRESRAHRAHTVLPVQEALRDYKEQILAGLQTLRDDRDKLLEVREAEMRRNWECLEKTESERQRVLSWFQGLRLSLEDHARALLARLGHLEREAEKEQEENLTSLTKEISSLDTRIQELEKKCQEPARTFLQDISSTLSRLQREHFQLPPSPLLELEEKISHFRKKNVVLEETLRSFQDILMFELPEKMTVTLDPSTAHPQLVVVPDGSGVRWEDPQDPPEEGLGPDPSVLGHEGITAGRRCWDVEVAPTGSWAVGVARETLKSRGETPGSPEEELWSMGLCQGQFWALTSLERVPLFQVQVPRRVRVSLDYERGQVAFFDAERRALIFAFPRAAFNGGRIHPWFLVWGEGAQI
ncbi:TRIM7 ligase, partial [Scytalopus superciliaris]|nr:TRIM7 ligase [Scytalopus superciliaris]